jgi:hypothetical protein
MKRAVKNADGTLQPPTDARSDMNVIVGFIRLKLRGHIDLVDVVISGGVQSNLWNSLQNSDRDGGAFVVFDGADGYCYAVKRTHLLSWHFKFDDPPVDAQRDGIERPRESPDETIRIWFSDGTPVIELDGVMDAPSDFHDLGPLNYIFSMLEASEDGAYSFEDAAEERFWFRSDELISPEEGEPDWGVGDTGKHE